MPSSSDKSTPSIQEGLLLASLFTTVIIYQIFFAKTGEYLRLLQCIWQGLSEHSDWFFLGQDFAIWTISMEMVVSCVFFVFESQQIRNKHGLCAIFYNKLLTNPASSRRTGEY